MSHIKKGQPAPSPKQGDYIMKTLLFKYIQNFTSKNWNFLDKKLQKKKTAQNTDDVYRRGGSNEYPQSVLRRNMKNIRIFIWKLSVFSGEFFNTFE